MRYTFGIILLILTVIALAGVRPAQAVATIRVELNCIDDPEYVIITNTGTQSIDLSTFRLVSKFDTRVGEEIRLSGTLAPGLSTRIEAGLSAGNPGAQVWTRSFVFDNQNLFQEGLILTVGTQQYEVPCGTGVNVASFVLPDAAGTITPTPLVTVTPTVAAAGGAATGTQNAWFDFPVGTPGAVAVCPPAGFWRLLYWGGPTMAIAQAIAVCAVDVVWVNRQGTWLGFAVDFPTQSDTWDQLTNEAAFLGGRTDLVGAVAPPATTVGGVAFTPTLTPTVSPTATITPTPTGTALPPGPAAPPSIQVVDFTGEVPRDGTARLTVRTVPFVNCTLAFGPPPSRVPVPVPNAGPRPADANGFISWNWRIEARTPTGIGGVAVTCGEATVTLDIRII